MSSIFSCIPMKVGCVISAVLLSVYCFFVPLANANTDLVMNDDEYYFDDALLKGNRFKINNIQQFNQVNNIQAGRYKVDLSVNNVFYGVEDVLFVESKSEQVYPCFSKTFLLDVGVKPTVFNELPEEQSNCLIIDEAIPGAKSSFSFSTLKLNLSIPQAMMEYRPRGYVPITKLDSGESMLFLNYMINQYHVNTKNSDNVDSTYANINTGFNIGLWRYRQQSFISKQPNSTMEFKTSNRYVQRAIPSLNSELLLGEGFTSGQFFSGMGFKGISLKTDERMLPDSRRGYAPEIQGIAKTTARVVIRQGGYIIYETTVPPGAFIINDLYNTNYMGDLNVSVEEADGTINSFIVPFSSVPESLRPGVNRYAFTLGQSRYVGDNDLFGELIYNYGLTNSITFNSGARLANGYQSLMLGGVYASYLGALGFNSSISKADLPKGKESGWMLKLSYSRTFEPTSTSLTIANYLYSASGYRELNDFLGIKKAIKNHSGWASEIYNRRSRFDVSINQHLNHYGSIYVSGSLQYYYDNIRSDKLFQIGYGKVFNNGVGLNLAMNRTSVTNYNHNTDKYESTFLASISIPLGHDPSSVTLTSSINHSSDSGNSYQSSLSGILDEENTTSYSFGYSRDSQQRMNTWDGNLQTRYPFGNLAGSLSQSKNYWQASASMQGAVVLHRGGITFGPYVGDTFALVEAKGAYGAKIFGGQGSNIDRFGYALIPSLSPYRFNPIIISPQGMKSNVELTHNQVSIAPYAGAHVRITFNTVTGFAILMMIKHMNSENAIPMGALIYEYDTQIGMVGQGQQGYFRTAAKQGSLMIRWGTRADEQCQVQYSLNEDDVAQPLIKLDGLCG